MQRLQIFSKHPLQLCGCAGEAEREDSLAMQIPLEEQPVWVLREEAAAGSSSPKPTSAAHAVLSGGGRGKSRQLTLSHHRRLTVARFIDNAAIHGLWHVGSTPCGLVWAAVLAAMLSCLGLHVFQQVSEYYKFPLQSSTREILNDFRFPSVTVCEAWQMRFFRGGYLDALRRIPDLNSFLVLSHSVFGVPKSVPGLHFLGNATALGVSVHDLLIQCKFCDSLCQPSQFSAFYHRQYGNCFTFRPEGSQERPHDGLSLILYSPASDPHFRNWSDPAMLDGSTDTGLETNGVLVTAHEADSVPRVSEDSIMAATSHETKIGLREVRTQLLNTPQRPCEEASEFFVRDPLIPTVRTYKTSLADRLEWQEAAQIQARCGCLPTGPVGLPTHLRRGRHCADLFDAQSGGFRGFKRRISELCGGLLKTGNFSACRELVRLNMPDLWTNWESLRCHQRLTEQLVQEAEHAEDQCSSSSYQFQIFTSELPDSASHQHGRYDARLIFQTFSSILDSYLKQFANSSLPADRLPAVVRAVRARQLRPGDCTRMDNERKFANETHCLQVQKFISRHFVRVQVYPFSLSVVYIAEERSYSTVDLLSHLGGILGLWMGSSVISLAELLELLTTLCASHTAFRLNYS